MADQRNQKLEVGDLIEYKPEYRHSDNYGHFYIIIDSQLRRPTDPWEEFTLYDIETYSYSYQWDIDANAMFQKIA